MSGGHDARAGALTTEEVAAWAALIELCEDECQVFATTPEMRLAIIKVDRQLRGLRAMALTLAGVKT